MYFTNSLKISSALLLILGSQVGCSSNIIHDVYSDQDEGEEHQDTQPYEPADWSKDESFEKDLSEASYVIIVTPDGEQKIYGKGKEGFSAPQQCTEEEGKNQCISYNRKQKLVSFENISVFTTIGSPIVRTWVLKNGKRVQQCYSAESFEKIDCN